jgi:3-methyl-2-oxobutanoate hydroxymethyltransferase
MMAKKMTIADFKRYKQENKRYTMITTYDYTTATMVNESKIETILVGDSLGNCVLGLGSTVPVTLDQMITVIAAVVKGAPDTFIIGDMPFGTYNVSCEQAVATANRIMKESGCDCVKLEGGADMADKIAAIVKSGTPVMGHIGLTPQTAMALGGMKLQGKNLESVQKLIDDVKAVEAAGAFACVVECVPAMVGKALNEAVKIPIFSGGAGPDCTGYGMNFMDMMGMFRDFTPKFVKRYANLREVMVNSLNQFHSDVETHIFPAPENCYNTKVEGLK